MGDAAPASDACFNCAAPVSGAYCSACGQKVLPLNPGVHDLLHEVTHEMLHVDGKIFQSVWKLLAAPGFLIRAQFEGRRARWISPIRLYLIFSLAYFAMTSLAPARGMRGTFDSATDQDTTEELRNLGFKSEQELREAMQHARHTWAPRVMFVLVPLFGWLVHGAYRRTGRNYPQHLYFALHVHAAWFAAGAFAAAAALVPWPFFSQAIAALALGYAGIYVVLASRTAYSATTMQAIRRALVVVAVYWLAVIVATLAIVLPVVLRRTIHGV
jgi:uncharacterized protein DUF3667